MEFLGLYQIKNIFIIVLNVIIIFLKKNVILNRTVVILYISSYQIVSFYIQCIFLFYFYSITCHLKIIIKLPVKKKLLMKGKEIR